MVTSANLERKRKKRKADDMKQPPEEAPDFLIGQSE
jgi:hypothetical protein